MARGYRFVDQRPYGAATTRPQITEGMDAGLA